VFYRFFRISILMCSPHFWPPLTFLTGFTEFIYYLAATRSPGLFKKNVNKNIINVNASPSDYSCISWWIVSLSQCL
jgi:hypothetical protein